ncbi:MAG TPA: hypothetical protein VM537_09865 [Anaerolineae bacterium]|nr:hypothetical protein [Anaerolineae bacterium]
MNKQELRDKCQELADQVIEKQGRIAALEGDLAYIRKEHKSMLAYMARELGQPGDRTAYEMTDAVAKELRAAHKRIAELEKALKQIGNVLGPGTCAACQCEGCAWEAKEAVRLAIDALKEAERG